MSANNNKTSNARRCLSRAMGLVEDKDEETKQSLARGIKAGIPSIEMSTETAYLLYVLLVLSDVPDSVTPICATSVKAFVDKWGA